MIQTGTTLAQPPPISFKRSKNKRSIMFNDVTIGFRPKTGKLTLRDGTTKVFTPEMCYLVTRFWL